MPPKRKKAVRKTVAKSKTATKRKRRAPEKVYSTKTVKAVNHVVKKGQAIINEIERLEKVRSNQKDADSKRFYAKAINAEHLKLRRLSNQI